LTSLLDRKKGIGAIMTNVLETYGIIRRDGTLEVAQKLAIPPGRVKLRIESMEPPTVPQDDLHMTPAEQAEASRLSQITRDPRWNDVGDESDLLE
jgi:hypothetical protein